jgi:hypothetical protein
MAARLFGLCHANRPGQKHPALPGVVRLRPLWRARLTREVRPVRIAYDGEDDRHRLWLPDLDGWDADEWGHDDDPNTPSLYSRPPGLPATEDP